MQTGFPKLMTMPRSKPDTDELFMRLRRVGWVILGDPVTTNIALDEVIDDIRDKIALAPLKREVELELFTRAVREFEATLKGERRVQFLDNSRQKMPHLANEIRKLSINERLALALIEVEAFSAQDASEITSRPAGVLSEALQSASEKMTPETPLDFLWPADD